MNKKVFNLWLFAALVCGLSLTVTSCKDDDKDDGSNGNGGNDSELELGPTDTNEAKAAYNWLINMTDIDDFTDDWASKTYEPTIGIESKNQANTRIVVVANIDYAKMNFASISGFAPSELTTTKSQTIDGVGTITWTPSAQGDNNLATVDVNTKLIPHLTKIVYCTVDQVGDNGGYEGTAFYRFGDVIEDTEGYYWVCVKPAFGTGSAPQQQGYWINILNRDPNNGKSKSKGAVPEIPTKNIKDYNKDGKRFNGNTIKLPTKLKSTKEQVHNLNNLVWALLDPDSYEESIDDDGIGLGGYDYEYNGKKFCQRVAEQWKTKGIWEKLFNRSYDQMKQMKKLNFFYNGYHWLVGSTAGVWISSSTGYESIFSDDMDADDTLFEMEEKGAGFDIRRYCSDPKQNKSCASSGKAGYAPAQQFTDKEGYWVVRQKTSSQIVDAILHPSVYATLTNTAEIYRYNSTYNKVVGSDSPVEKEDDLANIAPFENRGYYALGDVVKDESENRWFCVELSSFGTDKSSDEANYAYFVSFDVKAMGARGENLPNKDLAAQMLFHINYLFQNVLRSVNDLFSFSPRRLANIEKYAGVRILDLVAMRDTLHETTQFGETSISNYFTSTVYYDKDEKEFRVLRLIGDNTVENKGVRDFAWNFWDSYTCNPDVPMMLEDLQSKNSIMIYADDKWVNLPWHNPETDQQIASSGMRKPESAVQTDLGVMYYCYHLEYSIFNHRMPINMYNEPLYLITVKRVKDVGKPSKAFEDGTTFEPVSLIRDVMSDYQDAVNDIPNLGENLYLRYENYLNADLITLNGKRYDFKFTNKP